MPMDIHLILDCKCAKKKRKRKANKWVRIVSTNSGASHDLQKCEFVSDFKGHSNLCDRSLIFYVYISLYKHSSATTTMQAGQV